MTKKSKLRVGQDPAITILEGRNDDLRDFAADLLKFMVKHDSKMLTQEGGIELLTKAHKLGAIDIKPLLAPRDVWVNQFEHASEYDFGGIYDTEEGAVDACKKAHLRGAGGLTRHYTLAE